MRATLPRLLSVASALLLVLGLTACGPSPSPAPVDPVDDVTTTTTTVSTTTTTTAPKLGLNPLTGIEDMETDNNRPVGYVVPDESSKLVQVGIDQADMYFQAETEGGIPRLLCIFSSVDRIPDAIGPIRSARPHFVKMAAALDLIYCHIGGSPSGVQTIKDLGVKDIENASVVDSTLTAAVNSGNNASWNNKSFTKKKVTDIITKNKWATTTKRTSPFDFGTKEGDKPATTVDIKISASYHMAFTYDADRGVYQKHRNSLDTGIHKAANGNAVEVSNVIVMFDTRYVDTLEPKEGTTRWNFELKSGSGYLACGGTVREIRWTRTNNKLSYFEADGTTPLTVATGKTYIALVAKDYKSQTTFS